MVTRINRFYPKRITQIQLSRQLASIAAVNIVDKETDGDVGGQQTIDFPEEFPAGEIPDNQNSAAEGLYRRPRQAEIGQGITPLTTEREQGKTKQKDTQHGMWDESYSDENSFEDADLKLGELEDPVYPPYSNEHSPVDSRYEDVDKDKYNITLHANHSNDHDFDKLWVCIDLDGTLLSKPDDYVDDRGNHIFGTALPGASEALQKLIDDGARVSIYTARQYFNEESQVSKALGLSPDQLLEFQVEEALILNDIPFTDIYIGKKPPAHFYVDDRTIPPFEGDWDMVIDTVREKLEEKSRKKAFVLPTDTYITESEFNQLNQSISEIPNINQLKDLYRTASNYNVLAQESDESDQQHISSILKSSILDQIKILNRRKQFKIVKESQSEYITSDDLIRIYELEYKLSQLQNRGDLSDNTNIKKFQMEEELRLLLNKTSKTLIDAYEMRIDMREEFDDSEWNEADEDIENMLMKLQSANMDIILFHEALMLAHNNGDMLDYLNSLTRIDKTLLDDLSAGKYVNQWDEELNKTANDPVKDQVNYHGIKIDVEWPKGSIRSYEGQDTYVTHMKADYGYARGIEGNDGEELDIYLIDRNNDSPAAYIIEQLTADGDYDEDKIVLGAYSEGEAADIYLQHMPEYMLGDIREVPVERLVNALYGEPEDRRGEIDEVPKEELDKTIAFRIFASYSDLAMRAIDQANITQLSSLILSVVDPSLEYVDMIDELTRAMLRDESLRQQIESMVEPSTRPRLQYPDVSLEDLEKIDDSIGPTGTQKIIHAMIKCGTKTWPEDDIFENEYTDGTEDRENRDIPRSNDKSTNSRG